MFQEDVLLMLGIEVSGAMHSDTQTLRHVIASRRPQELQKVMIARDGASLWLALLNESFHLGPSFPCN